MEEHAAQLLMSAVIESGGQNDLKFDSVHN